MSLQIIENVNEIIIQGYAYADWIREIPNPQVCLAQEHFCSAIGRPGFSPCMLALVIEYSSMLYGSSLCMLAPLYACTL